MQASFTIDPPCRSSLLAMKLTFVRSADTTPLVSTGFSVPRAALSPERGCCNRDPTHIMPTEQTELLRLKSAQQQQQQDNSGLKSQVRRAMAAAGAAIDVHEGEMVIMYLTMK